MKFTIAGRKYEMDKFGVITQTDHRPYVYDKAYSAIYDGREYKRNSERLQDLRLGFVLGSHGSPIRSLLDIGYGNGAFINTAKQHVPYVYGYDITGVPLDGAYVMPEIVKADVITMFDVLEHFPDCSFVADLPCETLVVSLPYCHFHTEGLKWLETKYKHLKSDEHIRHFTEWSLPAFLDQYGWRPVAKSSHEDIIRKSTHGLQNIISMAFKRK
jgi:hypothetical protein